ncbi:MAG: acyl-CoA thioesterase [Bdellovibrio sp.]
MHSYDLLIREAHLDTFGHVNNATYLALYEEARWDLTTGNGFGLKDIQKLKTGPVILEVTVKFVSELKLREKIRITTELIEYKGKVGRLQQQMIKEDGTLASEALFIFGLFDLQARKLIEPTDAWKKAINWNS